MELTLQDLGSVGEFLGSVGVIISLIYLAVQIRQNTRSVRAATQQAFVDVNASFAGLLLHNEHMARVYRIGISRHSELSEDERVQFDMLMVTYFRNMQNLFHQHQRGMLESEVWEGSRRNMLWYIRQAGVRAWWETRRRMFSSEFCEFLEGGASAPPAREEPPFDETLQSPRPVKEPS
jgi:hypothetical protein